MIRRFRERAPKVRRFRNGSFASFMTCWPDIRLSPDSGGRPDIAQPPLGAKARSRCAPARCAGARAERPVAVERTGIAGWQGQHDQAAWCWRAIHDRARIIGFCRQTPLQEAAKPFVLSLLSFHAVVHDAGRNTTPCGTSSLVTRRQRAMSSLRASATIIVLRVLARPSAVPAANHWARALFF